MKFTFHIDAPIIRHKGGFIMSTIFPREEKAEQIFDEILKNPRACERLKDTFFAAIPSAEESEGAGTDIPGTVFAAALFNAYENKDLSAFMMAVCNNSVFDLLRNSFLIPIRFNDKGVENPIFLTDENGNLLDESKIISMKRSIRCSINSLKSRMRFQTTVCIWQMDFVKVMDILRTERLRQYGMRNIQESFYSLNSLSL